MWIDYAERLGFEQVLQKPTKEYAHRNNGRLQFDDYSIAERIFSRIRAMLPPTVDGMSPQGCSSNIRLYRYCKGQCFGRHVDESHSSAQGESKFTLLVYLNGAPYTKTNSNNESTSREEKDLEAGQVCDASGQLLLQGGETNFYANMYGQRPVVSVRPIAGRLLLHGHGHRCLTHEGAEVLVGVKYLLRTDVIYC